MPRERGFAHLFLLVLISTLVAVPLVAKLSAESSDNVQGVLTENHENQSSLSTKYKVDTRKSDPKLNHIKVGSVSGDFRKTKIDPRSFESTHSASGDEDLIKEIEHELRALQAQNLEFSNVDGQLEIEDKESTADAKLVSANKIKLNLKQGTNNKSEGHKDIELSADAGGLSIKSNSAQAFTKFPLSVNENGELVVNTGSGQKVIRVLPDQASDIAKDAGVQNKIDNIELIENPTGSSTDTTVFQIKGSKTGKLFGLISITAPVETQVGAETGQVLEIRRPAWLGLLNSLIK